MRLPRREFIKCALLAVPAIILPRKVLSDDPAQGYDNLANWPSAANRPTLSGNTLRWIGPLGGGPSTTNDVVQTQVLTNSGAITTSANGQVIQNLKITGGINVRNTGVIIRRCWVDGVYAGSASPNGPYAPTVEDCQIAGTGRGSGDRGYAGGGAIRRLNISGFENGIVCDGNPGMTIHDCYIHDLNGTPDPHVDGIECNGSLSNITIEHNRIEAWNTSDVNINNDFGSINHIVVNNNQLLNDPLRTAPAYCVYSDQKRAKPGIITNVQFTNNIMQLNFYRRYGSIQNNTVVWTGNTDYITGASIPLP